MAEKDDIPKPYWPPNRLDRQPGDKQVFSYKGFCAVCGTYSRRNLTRADYIDPIGKFRTSGLICGDCFAEVTETDEDTESFEGLI